MTNIADLAGPQEAAVKHGGGSKDDWKVQIFRSVISNLSAQVLIQCMHLVHALYVLLSGLIIQHAFDPVGIAHSLCLTYMLSPAMVWTSAAWGHNSENISITCCDFAWMERLLLPHCLQECHLELLFCCVTAVTAHQPAVMPDIIF